MYVAKTVQTYKIKCNDNDMIIVVNEKYNIVYNLEQGSDFITFPQFLLNLLKI